MRQTSQNNAVGPLCAQYNKRQLIHQFIRFHRLALPGYLYTFPGYSGTLQGYSIRQCSKFPVKSFKTKIKRTGGYWELVGEPISC